MRSRIRKADETDPEYMRLLRLQAWAPILVFVQAADTLGAAMAAAGNWPWFFGGGEDGLMGRLAHARLSTAVAASPGLSRRFLIKREHALKEAQELIVVEDMHQPQTNDVRTAPTPSLRCRAASARSKSLSSSSPGFNWGGHAKPVLVADIGGFWRPAAQSDRAYAQSWLHPRGLRSEISGRREKSKTHCR